MYVDVLVDSGRIEHAYTRVVLPCFVLQCMPSLIECVHVFGTAVLCSKIACTSTTIRHHSGVSQNGHTSDVMIVIIMLHFSALPIW